MSRNARFSEDEDEHIFTDNPSSATIMSSSTTIIQNESTHRPGGLFQRPSSFRLVKSTGIRSINKIGNVKVKDHFSLSHPTSTISFKDDEAIVLVDNLEQVILEKKECDDYIIAKQTTVSSPGLMLMRTAYTLVALLMSGFILVFCLQIVLFLFLGLAIESGMVL